MARETPLSYPIANVVMDCIQWGLSTTPNQAILDNFTRDSAKRASLLNFSDFLIKATDGFNPNADANKRAASQRLIDWLLPESNLPPAILILLSSQGITSQPQEYLSFGRNPIIPLLFCYETFPEKNLRLMNRTVTMEPTLTSIQTQTPAARFIESTDEYDMVHVVDIDPSQPTTLRQWKVIRRENIRNPQVMTDKTNPAFLPIGMEQMFGRYEREIQARNLEAVEKHRLVMPR